MSHKNIIIIFLLLVLISFGILYGYYYFQWKIFWSIARPEPSYAISEKGDDTLRVIIIGDSWAALHSDLGMDDYLLSLLKHDIMRPITITSRGKGGEKSRGVYEHMFETNGCGTKSLFQKGVDYCVISAGINDAATNIGPKQFCAHYRMILNFLLAHNIRPIIIEVPDVDLWNHYKGKPKKDLLVDYLRSTMTRCGMYNYSEYREALNKMLKEENLLESVIYISMREWNDNGASPNDELFISDRIHLNKEGYMRLDASIANAIVWDLEQAQDTAFVN